MKLTFLLYSAATLGLLAALAAVPASAQTLTFDNLPTEKGVASDSILSVANGGSKTISGITFNDSAASFWEIIGNQYKAPFSSNLFGQSHSGDYYLVGDTFSGADGYTGLTFSTAQTLQSLYIGFDDNGGSVQGSADASTLKITAFGTGGPLASATATLNGPAPSLFDTSSVFSGLTGVTGYLFETTASNGLYAANDQAYIIADDLKFSAPVPEASTTTSLGLLLALGLGAAALKTRRRAKSA